MSHVIVITMSCFNHESVCIFRAIDNYGIESKTPEGVDKMAVLKSLGNFAKIFCGAFALGSGMGMVTAIISFLLE